MFFWFFGEILAEIYQGSDERCLLSSGIYDR